MLRCERHRVSLVGRGTVHAVGCPFEPALGPAEEPFVLPRDEEDHPSILVLHEGRGTVFGFGGQDLGRKDEVGTNVEQADRARQHVPPQ